MPRHGEHANIPFTFDAAINEVHRYIESKITGKVVIVGLSLGGYIALTYCQKYQTKIKSLAVFGCCVQYVGFMGDLARLIS